MTSQKSILSESDRAQTFREIIRNLGELLKPRPRLNIWQWAEAKRFLARGVSAKSLDGPVPYRTDAAPHQRAPQESPTDPAVQVTVLIMASQIGGKTEIINNAIGYHMEHEPRNVAVMYPTIDSAEKYSKKKFSPMIEASPALAAILKPSRARDSGNTILVKDFTGGSIFFVGANSPPSLRQASAAVLIGDEIDSNPPSAGAEGDPIELLFKRGESFPNAVKILSSTPTIKGLSPIWDWFEQSDQQYWFVPCAKCGRHQVLKWMQIQWPKGQPDKTVLVCSHCAAALDDRQRLDMYFAGEWRPTATFNGIRGFHLNGIYCPWPAQKGYANRLEQMAREHLRAVKKGEFALRVWINTFLCDCFEEQTDAVDHNAILQRAEAYTPETLPNPIILITASIDVQKDRIECEVIGLGEDDETWGIEHKKFFGDTEQDDVWQDLAGHLGRSYTRADGLNLRISANTIDMRHKPHKVRAFCQRAGIARVFPVYGVSGHAPILVTTRFNKHYRLRTFAVNGKIAKDTIFARLKMDTPGPRYMHFPAGHGYSEEYFQQLTAEVLKRKRVRGVIVEGYEKIRDRNEALDIRVYHLAGLDILKPNLTAIAKNQKPPDEGAASGGGGASVPASRDYILKPSPDPAATPAKKNAKTMPKFPKKPGGGGFNPLGI